jgi:hypothetical protein
MPIVIGRTHTISEGDTEVVSVDYTDLLDKGELLTGTPTIVEVPPSDLTLGNKAVSTAELIIQERTVAIGAAVQFTVSGQSDETTYAVRITVSTDATPARTFVRDVQFTVT